MNMIMFKSRPGNIKPNIIMFKTRPRNKGPRKRLRIRPQVVDFEPTLSLKLGQTKPNESGTVPTNRHTTILNDSGLISACFDDGPKP